MLTDQQRPQWLFYMQRNEKDNVADEHPEIFARLDAALDEHLAA